MRGVPKMDKLWLPSGVHYGLHIDRQPTGRGESFVPAKPKLTWHTTEGLAFHVMSDVLVSKKDEPHILFGQMPDGSFRVRQYIPFNECSRALEHPPGTGETNRASCIQVEVCGFAKDSHGWHDDFVNALARMCLLIEHRVDIPRKAPRAFADTPHRYTQAGWLAATGHVGHEHAPSQPTGHWDPGRFPINRLFTAMAREEG